MTILTMNLVVGGGGGGGAVERAGGGARPDLEPEVKSQELSASGKIWICHPLKCHIWCRIIL